MANFNGQTAVITGGAQGIGLATAKRFINDGGTSVKYQNREPVHIANNDIGTVLNECGDYNYWYC